MVIYDFNSCKKKNVNPQQEGAQCDGCINLVPRVSHLPDPWSSRGREDERTWERDCGCMRPSESQNL